MTNSISQKLEAVWSKLEAAGVMRASCFNLIVVAPNNERHKYLHQITHNVIERFPCRVFLIKILKTGSLKIDVSASSIHGIACDTIEIDAPESELSSIPLLILPHFLSDLPIYLLWAQDPTANQPLLQELQKWATRFIYDSETAQDLSLFSQALLIQHQETKKEIADLNWARTESWRDLLAATFYSEVRLSSLKQAKTLEIHYNALETSSFCHPKIQAVYLMAWLKTRLEFNPKITFYSHQNHHLPPGAIISLDIVSKDQTHFSFHRDPLHLNQVLSIICDEEKCDIPSRFILSKTQAGLSLVNQIYHSDLSSHFSQVLQCLKDPLCCLMQN